MLTLFMLNFSAETFCVSYFHGVRILHMGGMQYKAYAQSGFSFLIMENRRTVVKMLYLAHSVGGQTVLSLKTLMCM